MIARGVSFGRRHREDGARAAERFRTARDALAAEDLRLSAWAAWARWAELRGDAVELAAAHARIASEGVVRPEGFVDLFSPLPP